MGERTTNNSGDNANEQKNPRQKQKSSLNKEPTARNTKEPHQLTNPTSEEKPEQKKDTTGTQSTSYQADVNFDWEWDGDIDPSLRED